MIEVNSPKYNNVDVDHPRLVKGIRDMVKDGRKTEDVMRIIGVPKEVVHKYEYEERRDKQKR